MRLEWTRPIAALWHSARAVKRPDATVSLQVQVLGMGTMRRRAAMLVVLAFGLLAPPRVQGEARLPVHRMLQYDHGKPLGSRQTAIHNRVRG